MPAIGIITALYSEASCLGSLVNRKNFIHKVSGIGASAASKAAAGLCGNGCAGLISFGYAGALNSLYQSGALVIGHSVSNGLKTINTSSQWLTDFLEIVEQENTIALYNISFLTSSKPLTSRSQKSAHALRGNWGAVDMESYVIAEVAVEFGAPVLIVRAILDELDTRIPEGSTKIIDPKGRQKTISTIFELLKHPSDFGKFLSLAKAKTRADMTLSRAAALIGRCGLPDIIPS